VNLEVEEGKVLVLSDLHLGSPVSRAAERLPALIRFAEREGFALCINGDAIDLLQGSRTRLLAELVTLARDLRRFQQSGGRIFYVLGNHDLLVEHLLADLPVDVVPFLNLTSAGRRIRIEHGHVYEPSFARWPGLYEFGGRLARPLLLARKDVYRLWAAGQAANDRRRRRREQDGYPYYRACAQLFDRGFDAMVLGHTHLPEVTDRPGGLFVNAGDWMQRFTYVEIKAGDITLKRWDG
jgi:UDP-2,3-diacylglucosamine pyrophosphatase LpxH